MNPSGLPLEGSYNEPLAIAGLAVNVLSLVLCLTILLIYCAIPEIRQNFFFTLGVHITMSDLVFGLSSLYIQDSQTIDSDLCRFLGIGREFGWMMSMFWTAAITFNIYHSIKENLSDEELHRKKWLYMVVCYTIPFCCSLVPGMVYKNVYGSSGIYCWLSKDDGQVFWILCLMLYLPLAISFILCAYWCTKTAYQMKLLWHNKIFREFLKLLLYPGIMVACNSGVVADTIYKRFWNSEGIIELAYYDIIGRQIQGLLNGLLFVLYKGVREAIKRRIRRCWSQTEEEQNVLFIRNLDELDNSDREEMIAKYFETKTTSVIDS